MWHVLGNVLTDDSPVTCDLDKENWVNVKVDLMKHDVTSLFTMQKVFLLLEQLAAQPLGLSPGAVPFLMVCGAWLLKF